MSLLSSEAGTALQSIIISSLAGILPQLVLKLFPLTGGASFFINTMQWFVNNADTLSGLITAFAETVSTLTAPPPANGEPTAFQTALTAFLDRAAQNLVPLALSFVAGQFGLGNLPQMLQKALSFIPNTVDAQLRKLITALANKVLANLGLSGGTSAAAGAATGRAAPAVVFSYNGQMYDIVVTQAKGSSAVVNLITASGQFLGVITAPTLLNVTQPKNDLNKLIADAGGMMVGNNNGNLANKGKVPALKDGATNVVADENALAMDLQSNKNNAPPNFVCTLLNGGCFAAGTKLWTPDGYRTVESIQAGESVYARPEFELNGPIEAKLVEKKFERTGRLFHVHHAEGVIRTTPEHPFFVKEKGWTEAYALQAGDMIATASEEWVEVCEVVDTGVYETVYNLRVADYHTYFVGEKSWGFAIWVHNIDCASIAAARTLYGELPAPPVINGSTKEIAKVQGYNGTFASGQTVQIPGFVNPEPLVPEVIALATTMGFSLPRSGPLDHLGPGSYYAGPAEKFASLYGTIIAIKPLDACPNCNSWFESLSSYKHTTYYLAVSATTVRIYDNGTLGINIS